MAATSTRLPFVWDYDLDEAQSRRLLSGELTLGRLDRTWASVRLLEHAPYRDIVRLMGFRGLAPRAPSRADIDLDGPGPRLLSHAALSLQDRILAPLASIDPGFYVTAGTAASRRYLHHRFSDDLDFFDVRAETRLEDDGSAVYRGDTISPVIDWSTRPAVERT